MSSKYESDAEPMSTYMLEDIFNGSQSHPRINRIEAHYNIRYCIKQGQSEWKGELLSTLNRGKGSQKLFKAVVNKLSEALSILG